MWTKPIPLSILVCHEGLQVMSDPLKGGVK